MKCHIFKPGIQHRLVTESKNNTTFKQACTFYQIRHTNIAILPTAKTPRQTNSNETMYWQHTTMDNVASLMTYGHLGIVNG